MTITDWWKPDVERIDQAIMYDSNTGECIGVFPIEQAPIDRTQP